jgi:hypothetical protein
MKLRVMIAAAIAFVYAPSVFAPSAFAQFRSQSRIPSADYDGRDRQYEVPAGTVLRSGDRLTDRMLVTIWQRTTVTGAGRCNQGACPVIFNGQDMYARRSRLSIVDGNSSRDPRRDNVRDDPPRADDNRRADDTRRDARGDDRARSKSDNRYPEGWARLQRGDQGENVKRLQELLNREGARLNTNGTFDQSTLNAVREFQRRKRLQADGVVGYETLRQLGV